jgi:flagellar motor switch protein FliM
VAETSAVSELNPFQQSRLLTSERTQLFTRTAETLAERLEDELSRWLSDSTVRLEPVEQVVISDLAKPDTDLAIVKSNYHLSHGVIATDLKLALSIVAVLCGGIGQPPPEVRPLSRLEMGVFDLVLQPVVNLTTELFEVGPCELGTHVTNASGLPDSQPEPAIAIPLLLSVANIEGCLTIGLTAGQLQAYSEELDRRIAGRMATKNNVRNVQIVRAVRPVPVDLIVGFDLMQVPAGQLAGLQIGDVLRTQQSVSKSLVARVGSERIFYVRAAQRGQRLVAELIGRVGAEKGSQ